MKRIFAALAVFAVGLAAACSSNVIDGQGAGCTTDTDCPSGNNLKCTPFRNNTGGSCQIQCDPSKTGQCPDNQVCGEIPNILPAVCKVVTTSNSGGSGTTGTATSTTGTAATTTTGG